MALDSLRSWARTKNPIPFPPVVSIQIQDAIDDFGQSHLAGLVSIALIEEPGFAPDPQVKLTAHLTPDLLYQEPLPVPLDVPVILKPTVVARFKGLDIPTPEQLTVPFSFLWSYPDILDLFTGSRLTLPKLDGKAYGTNAKARNPVELEANVESLTKSDKCRHGLPSYICATCREEQEQKAYVRPTRARGEVKKARTINVFDLLLPYLQPPIENLLAEPLLFPADKRPYDYQITGIKFLAEREAALLGDEMGLGKTIQTIVAMQLLFRRGHIRRVLILCPVSLIGTWARELEKWAPELFLLKVRGNADERKWLWLAQASIYVTTYETLRQDIDRVSQLHTRFDLVVLDETQKIKNPASGMAKAVRKLKAKYRWGLSGTPLENKVEDVTAIFSFLQPTLFPPHEGPYPPNRIKQRMAPYFLRRRTADVRKELPEKVVHEIWLELTEAQRRIYNSAETAGRHQLSRPDATRIHVFKLISELKQICNLDPVTGASCKLEYLLEQLGSITDSGQKALVFSHFPQKTLREIESKLLAFNPARFDGSLTEARREMLLQEFQKAESPKVLLLSVQAGGVGLTLTRANHVFHFDHWWNPAVANQATGRAHRIGQTQTVFVHDIYTSDTIEERIHKLLAEKQHLFDVVIDDLSAEYVQGTISDEELFKLFDLEPPKLAVQSPSTSIRVINTTKPGSSSSTNQAIQNRLNLEALTWEKFEHLVARLYEKIGFVVEVTPRSRDGGVDIYARRLTDIGVDHLIIQCKHYPNGAVHQPDVQKLIGVREGHRGAKAVLVTSGRFSEGAISWATEHQVLLVDKVNLRTMLKRHLNLDV